jgi:lipopolysaccharide exporter
VIAQRAVRGTIMVLVSSYANMAFGIVYGILMARLLDPNHFGLFALGMFFFSLLDLRSKLGLDYAFIHRQPTTEHLIATHWALQLGASILTLGLILLAGWIIPILGYPSESTRIMPAIAGAMVIEAIGGTARVSLEKELIFANSTLVITGSLFISYVIALVLALQGYTYWALVAQVVVNATLGSIGFWWAYYRLKQRPAIRFAFDRPLAEWMFRFGLVMVVGSIATTLLLQFDNFLVGTIAGVATLGLYAQAYKVAQWPTGLVTHIVSRVSLPTYAKLQNDAPRLAKSFEMSLWLILTLATPLALAIFVAAPDFIILLYGEKWLPAATLLRFLIGYSVLRPLLDDTGALFTAIGQPKRVSVVLMIQSITLIVVATPMTWLWSATGTAIAVGITFIIGIGVMYSYVNQTVSIDLIRLFMPIGFAIGLSLLIYYMFSIVVNLNELPLLLRVIIKGGFVVSVFSGLVLILERRSFFDRIGYIGRLLKSGLT